MNILVRLIQVPSIAALLVGQLHGVDDPGQGAVGLPDLTSVIDHIGERNPYAAGDGVERDDHPRRQHPLGHQHRPHTEGDNNTDDVVKRLKRSI